jgi:hypothetical protein
MNLLTLIGSAAVDYRFRAKFLKDPVSTARAYGFQLTKFDAYMLNQVFTPELSASLEEKFGELEQVLYQNLSGSVQAMWPGFCMKPCGWSLMPPEFHGAEDYENPDDQRQERVSHRPEPALAAD